MSYDRRFATAWQLLLDSICTVMGLGGSREPPIILSSLPDLPYSRDGREGRAPLSFIQGPPGRNIALAIGLRAALPRTPLVLIMHADSITLGTNHLIHAARRNIGMTLLLLRSEVARAAGAHSLDRSGWDMPAYQRELETASRPLDWVSALHAAFVGRGRLDDPDQLAQLIHDAIDANGFAVIGVTTESHLPLGVLSRTEYPEYFAAYREWTKGFAQLAAPPAPDRQAPKHRTRGRVPRCEVRIVGLGGQGVKLAGTVLRVPNKIVARGC
jgi:hypothetical protein